MIVESDNNMDYRVIHIYYEWYYCNKYLHKKDFLSSIKQIRKWNSEYSYEFKPNVIFNSEHLDSFLKKIE